MPLPTARERRLALRLRASELVGLMEATDGADPEARGRPRRRSRPSSRRSPGPPRPPPTRRAPRARPADVPDASRSTTGAGANLLQVAPLPATPQLFVASSTYDSCPLKYAFGYVYRMPPREEPVAAFTFGSTAHAAFEAFTKERRERAARGEPPPTREDLERAFRARWTPTGFGDKATEEGYQRRVATLLDNFWTGEVSSLARRSTRSSTSS